MTLTPTPKVEAMTTAKKAGIDTDAFHSVLKRSAYGATPAPGRACHYDLMADILSLNGSADNHLVLIFI